MPLYKGNQLEEGYRDVACLKWPWKYKIHCGHLASLSRGNRISQGNQHGEYIACLR